MRSIIFVVLLFGSIIQTHSNLHYPANKSECREPGMLKCNYLDGDCIWPGEACYKGQFFCPKREDDWKKCTKEFCSKLDLFQCPENLDTNSLCIPNDFVCDGEHESYGPFICSSGHPEDSEKICKDYCTNKNEIPCPYEKYRQGANVHVWAKCTKFCRIQNGTIKQSSLVKNGFLWRCAYGDDQNPQYILKEQLCNGLHDCLFGEDESGDLCQQISWPTLLFIIIISVTAISLLTLCIRRMKIVSSSSDCNECTNSIKISIDIGIWRKIQCFMGINMDHYQEEWRRAGKDMSLEEVHNAYEEIHKDTKALIYVYAYIRKRIEATFTLGNWKSIMYMRHNIYQMLYLHELEAHDNDEIQTLLCIQKKIGHSADASSLLEFKEYPTVITKFACMIGTLTFNVSLLLRGIIPLFKVIALMFDLVRDYVLLYRMVEVLSNSAKDYIDSVIPQDILITSSYVVCISIAHILTGLFAYVNRNSTFQLCPHQESKGLSILLKLLGMLVFPCLGAVMSTTAELEASRVDKKFKDIKNGDWSRKVLTKEQFEDVISHSLYNNHCASKGFAPFKLLESSVESFGQIILTICLLTQDPFDGVLNRSLMGLGEFEDSTSTVLLFAGSTILTFIFLICAFVSFFNIKQGNSMDIAGKAILFLVYGLMVTLNILLMTAVGITRQDYGDVIAFSINLGIVTFKAFALVICVAMFQKRREKSMFDRVLFLASNIVAPMPFEPLEEIQNTERSIFVIRFLEPICLCAIFFMDTYIRGIYIALYASDEDLSSIGLSSGQIWIMLVFITLFTLVMLNYYIHFHYMYKHILYSNENHTAPPLEGHVVQITRKLKGSFYFWTSTATIIFICMILLFSFPKVTLKQQIYKDCHDVWANKQKDGVYPIFADNQTENIKYTTCIKGKTLIQKTSPEAMNRNYYFKRNIDQYAKGFGFTNREYFIGLETLYHLNSIGNDEIILDATMHNGTSFSTTFTRFELQKEVFDDTPYLDDYYGPRYLNRTFKYVIKSIQNSRYILINPIFKVFTDFKDRSRNQFTSVDFLHFHSFTSLDSFDNQCSVTANSGWWFDIVIHTVGPHPDYGINCAHDYSRDYGGSTNLNGVYHPNEDLNQRTIDYCDQGEKCFVYDKKRYGGKRQRFTGQTIKLKSTRMFLSRGVH